jgi:hypothetical protein
MNRRGLLWGLVLWTGGCAGQELSSKDLQASPGSSDMFATSPDMLETSPDMTTSCLETAAESLGIFVGAIGQDVAGCGTADFPCKTLQKGLSRAAEAGFSYVFPMPGSYAESVALAKGVTIVGGWTNMAGTWQRVCPGDPGLVQIIGGAIAVTATDLRGAAGLESVTITSSAAAAQNGQSTYGLSAIGASTELSLRNVVINAGDGISGAVGSAPGVAGAPQPAGSCAATPTASGMAGSPGNSGMGGAAGLFDQDGYHPGDGADGDIGTLGGDGLVKTDYMSSNNCSDCLASGSGPSLQCTLTPPVHATGYPGQPGCGGQGGPGGGGGKGGGSSIGLFVFDARVTIVDSRLVAGNGGPGGVGTSGAVGGSSSSGVMGDTRVCYQNCGFSVCLPPCNDPPPPCTGNVASRLAGGTATAGGTGGRGGQGGGGAGGWSVPLVKLGTANVTSSGTQLQHGLPGAGGVAAMPGQAGVAVDVYP